MIRNLFVCIIELTFLVYLGIESFEPRNTITKKELFVTYDETDYIAGATYNRKKLIDYVAFYSTIFVGDICVEIFSIYTAPLKSDKCKYRSPYIVNKCDLVKGGTIERHYGFFRVNYLFFNNLGVLKDRKVGGINYTVFARVCNEGGINRYATRLIVLKPFKLKCVNVQVLDPNLFDSKVAINVSWSKKYTIHQLFRFDILLFRDNSCIFYMEINVNNKMEIGLNKPLPRMNKNCSIKLKRSKNVTEKRYFKLLVNNKALISLEKLTIRVIPINGFGEGSHKDSQVTVGKYFSSPPRNITVNDIDYNISWRQPSSPNGVFGGYIFYTLLDNVSAPISCLYLQTNTSIGHRNKLQCTQPVRKYIKELNESITITLKDLSSASIHLINGDMFFIAPFNDYGVSNGTVHVFVRERVAQESYTKIPTSAIFLLLVMFIVPTLVVALIYHKEIVNAIRSAKNKIKKETPADKENENWKSSNSGSENEL